MSSEPTTLKDLRLKHDKTLQDVAEFCSVDPSTVHRWEKKGEIPDNQVTNYAAALGVDVKRVEDILGPIVVTNDNDRDKWLEAVATTYGDQLIKFLIMSVFMFVDEDVWVAFVTPEELAARVKMDDVTHIERRWDEMLESPFLEKRGEGMLLLTLPRTLK